jgi:hypothetical protein
MDCCLSLSDSWRNLCLCGYHKNFLENLSLPSTLQPFVQFPKIDSSVRTKKLQQDSQLLLIGFQNDTFPILHDDIKYDNMLLRAAAAVYTGCSQSPLPCLGGYISRMVSRLRYCHKFESVLSQLLDDKRTILEMVSFLSHFCSVA